MNPYDDLANRGHIPGPDCPCSPCRDSRQKPPTIVKHFAGSDLLFAHLPSASPHCWLCQEKPPSYTHLPHQP